MDFDCVNEFNWFNETIEELIKKCQWDKLSLRYISDEITEKYRNFLNWKIISANWDITQEFYDKYHNELKDYEIILRIRNLNIKYNDYISDKNMNIEELIKTCQWDKLSLRYISDEITEKYRNVLKWRFIAANWNITQEFYDKYKNELKDHKDMIEIYNNKCYMNIRF